MRVLLDERPCDTDPASIGEAIADAASVAEAQGRIVIEVLVDGVAWTEHELDSSVLRAGRAEEIRLTTANLSALVLETLDEAADSLVEADRLQREAAVMIQSGRQAEAMDQLGAALDIWLGAHDTVVKCAQAATVDLESIVVGTRTLPEHVQTLQRHLQTLHGALASGDPVGVADTLLYDLPEVVADWREVLATLRAQVETPSADSTGASDPSGDR
jgi:hypothetical protein